MEEKPMGEPQSSFHTGLRDASLRSWPILHYAYPRPQMLTHLRDEEIITLPCTYCASPVRGSKTDGWVHQ